MPFNGSGTFTIINTFVPNTTILSAAVNQNFTDIATGLSDCLTRDGQAGMTAVFKAVSGSVSAPGITFNSDATSGLFLSASGIPGFVANSLGMLLNTQVFSAVSATVQAAGSGYAVGDIITATGGTAIAQPVYTVASLSGSAVATVTVTYPGFYTATPSNPVSQGSTSGIGTGCTLNVTYNVPASSDYRALFTDQAGALLWQKFGASSYVSGLMNEPNALAFAQGIGGTALATALGGVLLPPVTGVLSPISSTTAPIPTSDATAVTTIFWTPFKGNTVPIFNGTQFVVQTPGQLSCALTSGAQALGGIYDVYMFLNAGTPTLGFSPSWSAGTSGSVVAGSCARGTGTGGTALAVLNGLYVNAVQQTVNNGATTYTMPINQGTYLGSIYVNAVAGQINCFLSFGQSRVWGLWNANNRHSISMQAGDSTASWTYGTNTIRPSNNSTANSITVFAGLPEEPLSSSFTQKTIGGTSSPSQNTLWAIGIGWNSTTIISGLAGSWGPSSGASSDSIQVAFSGPASYTNPPAIGINVITALEVVASAAGGVITFDGTSANMLLTASYRA